jgi:hypothetical protein
MDGTVEEVGCMGNVYILLANCGVAFLFAELCALHIYMT